MKVDSGKRQGFNWWAFIFCPWWHAYKGMWGKAALYLLLGVASTTVAGIMLGIAGAFLGSDVDGATLGKEVGAGLFAVWVGFRANRDLAEHLNSRKMSTEEAERRMGLW